jgi:glycine/sarcosine N-methyltransferase
MVMLNIKKFYDSLAGEYDSMTSFGQRLLKDELSYRSLVEKYKIKTALDAGAGTGAHSILLAQASVKVTAVDISQEMLKLLSLHAKEKKVNVKTIKSDFLDLPNKVNHKFDSVFCMGNSLAHAKTRSELRRILSNFHSLLKPNGTLFIQILNYYRIILNREIIQSIKESNGKTFIRFYGFTGDQIDFHLLTIERKDGTLNYNIITTQLLPITPTIILKLLKEAGFKKINYSSQLEDGLFNKRKSKDLFIKAS